MYLYKYLRSFEIIRIIIEYSKNITRVSKQETLVLCAGHGTNSVRDKLTTGLYRQV